MKLDEWTIFIEKEYRTNKRESDLNKKKRRINIVDMVDPKEPTISDVRSIGRLRNILKKKKRRSRERPLFRDK